MRDHVIAIDQSTSASKAYLIDAGGAICARASVAHRQYYPQPGYVEHDAEEIWQNTLQAIQTVARGVDSRRLLSVAISNQRETTVLWARKTGRPIGRAMVWQDTRGASVCAELKQRAGLIERTTGLKLSPYYPAAKIAFALKHNPKALEMANGGDLCVGTVDSYLLYRLTRGAVFATDMSNAGRTQLMNLSTGKWDAEMCRLFGIPMQCLPQIKPSDADFGAAMVEGVPDLPIAGVMGDSHAALFGHGCLKRGDLKATFGTGSSVMLNVGQEPVFSAAGLSACVGFAWQGKVCYALEGNITSSGDTLCWLKNEMGLIEDVDQVEELAASVPSAGGVFLIPAFSGMGAPYFSDTARAALTGIGRNTTKAHIVRAALESMAYQDADIIDLMEKETGIHPDALHVDGGPTHNRLLMQMLADMTGCAVQCAAHSEMSALGAGFMSGLAMGLFRSFDEIPLDGQRKEPFIPMQAQRRSGLERWRKAVAHCIAEPYMTMEA